VPVHVAAIGGMWGFFLTNHPVVDYETARISDTSLFARLFHALLDEGVYIAPSTFEACFVATAHDAETLAVTRRALTRAFAHAAESVEESHHG